jgi:hypothetical protein
MTTRERLKTLQACSQVWEAEILRDRLAAAGFTAFVQGAETGRSLSYVGVALGGVKVQVPEGELAAARKLLEEDALVREQARAWTCPRCGEPNEAAFDFCYSCALPRSASEPQSVRNASAAKPSITIEPSATERAGSSSENPYQAPGEASGRPARRLPPVDDSEAAHIVEGLRDRVRRATTWCVFGAIIPFPLLFLISMFLALRVWFDGAGRLASLRRWLVILLIVDAVATLATSLLWFG